jgi:hypothetical protein
MASVGRDILNLPKKDFELNDMTSRHDTQSKSSKIKKKNKHDDF